MSYTLVSPPSHSASPEVGKQADSHRDSMGSQGKVSNQEAGPGRAPVTGRSWDWQHSSASQFLYLGWLSKASVCSEFLLSCMSLGGLHFLYWVPAISNRLFPVIASNIGYGIRNVTKINAMEKS